MVFRDPGGSPISVPAITFAVNCHGAGIFATERYPLGSELFLMDGLAGVGAWCHLVWEGLPLSDGRQPMGVEFAHAANYWGQRLVPRNWMPFLYLINEPVILGESNRTRESLMMSAQPAVPGARCVCCGNPEGVAIMAARPEPLCKVCRAWAV